MEILKVDMTFSVTKFLSTTAGLAIDNGLIKNVGDTVKSMCGMVHLMEITILKLLGIIY
jgi:hypothetical protein